MSEWLNLYQNKYVEMLSFRFRRKVLAGLFLGNDRYFEHLRYSPMSFRGAGFCNHLTDRGWTHHISGFYRTMKSVINYQVLL